MSMWVRRLTFVFFAWILWMDQSVYTLPRGGPPEAPAAAEGATGKWQQLAILPTQAVCEAQRQSRVQEAATRDATAPGSGRYGERFRFFCSPVGDPPDK
jgi:hypothetical protein